MPTLLRLNYLNVLPLEDEFVTSDAAGRDLLDVQVRRVVRGGQLSPQQAQVGGRAHS